MRRADEKREKLREVTQAKETHLELHRALPDLLFELELDEHLVELSLFGGPGGEERRRGREAQETIRTDFNDG